ncbi:hypothetical protein D3C73_484490 [compost metagenome]
MKNNVLILKWNLLPWYDEADTLDIEDPSFPSSIRQKILEFGKYNLILIHSKETRLIRSRKD